MSAEVCVNVVVVVVVAVEAIAYLGAQLNFYIFCPHLLSDLVKSCVRKQHVMPLSVFLNFLHNGAAEIFVVQAPLKLHTHLYRTNI
jgi:hypothetical protein